MIGCQQKLLVLSSLFRRQTKAIRTIRMKQWGRSSLKMAATPMPTSNWKTSRPTVATSRWNGVTSELVNRCDVHFSDVLHSILFNMALVAGWIPRSTPSQWHQKGCGSENTSVGPFLEGTFEPGAKLRWHCRGKISVGHPTWLCYFHKGELWLHWSGRPFCHCLFPQKVVWQQNLLWLPAVEYAILHSDIYFGVFQRIQSNGWSRTKVERRGCVRAVRN